MKLVKIAASAFASEKVSVTVCQIRLLHTFPSSEHTCIQFSPISKRITLRKKKSRLLKLTHFHQFQKEYTPSLKYVKKYEL